jgi:hypothetical protein
MAQRAQDEIIKKEEAEKQARAEQEQIESEAAERAKKEVKIHVLPAIIF